MVLSEYLVIWLLVGNILLQEETIGAINAYDENYYTLRGPPFSSATLEVIEGKTVDENILAMTKRRIHDLFIKDAITGKTLGWNEFIRKGHSLAAGLQELGCNRGSIVGIISENRVEYPIVYLGTWLAGAILNNFDPLSSTASLAKLYALTKPSIIIGPSKQCDKFRTICPKCTFIVFDTDDQPFTKQFSSLTDESTEREFKPVDKHPDDVAFIMYSSGTTGLPKAIQLSHKGLVYLNKLFQEKKIAETEGKTMVSDRGFCHGMGLVIFLITVVRNQTLIVMPKELEENHDEELFLKTIQDNQIKQIMTVPSTIMFILKSPVADKYDLSCLDYIISSASPLKPKNEKEIKEKLGLKNVIQIYGSTESMLNTTKKADSKKLGTVGCVNPELEMKVVDLETKSSLKANKRGEIWVRGVTITKGYYGDIEATTKSIDSFGWFHTGDLGYYDDDGDFFIVDRITEVIRYKAYPVSPAELESVLLTHPAIKECAVVGVPHEEYTALPKAYVVKRSGQDDVTEQDIVGFIEVSEDVSPYAKLRGGVEFVSELPKTSTGKIARREVKQWVLKSVGESIAGGYPNQSLWNKNIEDNSKIQILQE